MPASLIELTLLLAAILNEQRKFCIIDAVNYNDQRQLQLA